MLEDRRKFLALAGVGLTVVACKKKDDEDEDVGAVEDLMREHGVIRRALVVFRESAQRLRAKTPAPLDAIVKAAHLVRTFGEDYHERALEETHIFPAVKHGGGPAAAFVDTLIEQHQRGREAIDFVLAQKTLDRPEDLARALESFARMYEYHAALEDTEIFPAWKRTMSKHELSEKGEQFEDIEKKTFGKDGFDDGVTQIRIVEAALGLTLASMTIAKT